MPSQTKTTKTNTRMTPETEAPCSLSTEASVQQIRFTAEVRDGQKVVHELPPPVRQKAVLIHFEAVPANAASLEAASTSDCAPIPPGQLQILTIPSTGLDDPQVLAAARSWVERGGPENERRCLPILLQGAQIFWSPERTAVIAPPDRMNAVRGAILRDGTRDSTARSSADARPIMPPTTAAEYEAARPSVRPSKWRMRRSLLVTAAEQWMV